MRFSYLAAGGVVSLAGATLAWAAEGNPVQGVGVSVEQSPGGIMVSQKTTDAKGEAAFDLGANKAFVVKVTPASQTTGKLNIALTIGQARTVNATLTLPAAKPWEAAIPATKTAQVLKVKVTESK